MVKQNLKSLAKVKGEGEEYREGREDDRAPGQITVED